MVLLFYFLTGLIQGLTEFLPVSSSGHLVLFQHIYGREGLSEENHFLNVMVHLGTVIAIIIVFRKQIKDLIVGFFSIPSMIRKNGLKATMSDKSVRFIIAVIVGTIPAVFVGYFLRDQISGISSILFIGFMFLITALLLFISKIFDGESYEDTEKGGLLSVLKGFIIGIAQAIAILPGISRSGSTITTGRFLGLNRETSASFSFILSLPAIIGASILELTKAVGDGFYGINIVGIIIGFLTSLFVGAISLIFLIRFINKGKFHYFGFYLIIVSMVCFVLFFMG